MLLVKIKAANTNLVETLTLQTAACDGEVDKSHPGADIGRKLNLKTRKIYKCRAIIVQIKMLYYIC